MIAVSGSLTELKSLIERKPEEARERAAKEFEAMVLNELMKAGNKPLMGESLLDGGSAGRMAREQFYSQLAIEATRGSGLGLADQLARTETAVSRNQGEDA